MVETEKSGVGLEEEFVPVPAGRRNQLALALSLVTSVRAGLMYVL